MSKLRDWVRVKIKTFAHRYGYDIVNTKQHGENGFQFVTHPLDAFYSGRPIDESPLRVALWKCSNYTGLTYGAKGWHPFVETLRRYQTRPTSYKDSVLKSYYDAWKPSDAAEAFITFQNPPEAFELEPSYAFVSPWHTISISDRKSKIAHNVRAENRDMGYETVGIEEGFGLHGPVSERKGSVEFDRLISVLNSVERDGYRLDSIHYLIEGFALLDQKEEDFRIIVVHGNHRLASLSALDYEYAPVRLVPPYIVRAEEVDRWPQVTSGLWSKDQAVEYFQSFFGAHREIRRWAKSLRLIQDSQ